MTEEEIKLEAAEQQRLNGARTYSLKEVMEHIDKIINGEIKL